MAPRSTCPFPDPFNHDLFNIYALLALINHLQKPDHAVCDLALSQCFSGTVSLVVYEVERGRVYAVSQVRWSGPVVENMPQVCVAKAAVHFGPNHAPAAVGFRFDVVCLHRFPKAGPARSRLELGVGSEQSVSAAHTPVHTLLFPVMVLSVKRPLCTFFAGYFVLLRSQLLAPLIVGLINFIGHNSILAGDTDCG